MAIEFVVNGKDVAFEGDPEMPLLWYLRDHAQTLGVKYGCGVGACGACTVHVDGGAVRSCSMPVSAAAGRKVTTIEGLAHGNTLHALQRAWIEEDVPQCGYCQAGQIMAAADLLARKPDPSDEEIAALTNLCRCGTYPRIRKAIRRAAGLRKQDEVKA
ncbi:MAG: (2Fe-2S)-binding protein [Dokdonella sp.]|nr:(2Fe-2S)-binding protein [Dokdonella sp.]MCB1569826.1 (2Fe-2S)-binding protein [Xanthomonadales bacterium]MCB1574699.1 (2Fe-2S)-binding protein [Xanthomonadales bacterium]